MRIRVLGVLFLLFSAAAALRAQDNPMSYAAAATSKFVNMPGLPACMTIAVQRGDPSKGPSVLLLKFKAGCVVPWHWHTANETLMMVSGHGKAEMKGGDKPISMSSGDFLYLPSKSIHQFTATTSVLLYDLPDGAFDIHYVDANGTEIPPDQALKPMHKAMGMAKKPMEKKPE